ncbi:MAG: hypothetical protein CVT94_14400 [Bacteroidetes bacterium HGW-Bacteroidetes-11]|jgi:hypothetical protein|nr:MAG: hypothetical protein CVT94_14400 [Bacteroidetes bacterium HGW-Bacteroidetes-11]
MKELKLNDARKVGEDLGIDWNQISLEEFALGINVEFEHGTRFKETNITDDDKMMTGQIAWAHLKEFPDYYSRLKKMEEQAAQFWENNKK